MRHLKSFAKRPAAVYSAAAAIAVLIIYSRRPDAFLNPQFWAEDGRIWYAQAYNEGVIYSLTTPEAGYFQTVSRLVAIFAQAFPLEYAPLIFNLAAVAAKLLVVGFLLSRRTENFLPQLWMRIFAAFVYLAMPHSYEPHANLTNAQWHLALLACLVIAAAAPARRFWKIFDLAAVSISVLSGPFCLFLLPVGLLKYWRDRDRWTLYLLTIVAAGCLVQGIALLAGERPGRAPLGANVNLFLRILGGHLFLSAIFGENSYAWTLDRPFWKDGVSAGINLLGLALVAYAFLKADFEIKLLLVFAALIAAGAFLSPAVSSDAPQWEIMRYPVIGTRYWMIPIFVFLLALFSIARRGASKPFRYAALALLALAPVGIYQDWQYPAYVDYDFPRYAEEFERLESGRELVIPINPNWEMRLVKK